MRVQRAGDLPCKSLKIHISTQAQGMCHRKRWDLYVLRHHLIPPQQEPHRTPPQGKDLGPLKEGLAFSL